MSTGFLTVMLALACGVNGELLTNGGFETMAAWPQTCWGFTCDLIPVDESRFGSHSLKTHGRTQWYQGPLHPIQTSPGKSYHAQSWVKLLNDKPGKLFQNIQLEVDFKYADGTHDYINIAYYPGVSTSNGWVFLEGDFQAPDKTHVQSKFYYQGPDPGVHFAVDLASVIEVASDPADWQRKTDAVIDQIRKNINLQWVQ